MCRFALYLGSEVTIGSLLTEPTNSIVHQSFHCLQRDDPLNGDGFGIAWYVPGVPDPAVFRDITPAWNNLNLLQLARVTRTTCLLSHVRAATPGMPVQQVNCHPFHAGPFAFVHNGSVGGFRLIRRALLARLSQEAFDTIHGSTDTEHIFALFLDRHREVAGNGLSPLAAMEAALRAAIRDVEEMRAEAGVTDPSVLNLAVTDGTRGIVSRYISHDPENASSLYVHEGDRYVCEGGRARLEPAGGKRRGAVVVASEPLSNDSVWTSVPPNHLVLVHEDRGWEFRPI